MPDAVRVGGFDWYGVLYLAALITVMFLPVLLRRRAASPPADGGSDDDRGGGLRRPRTPPRGPIGGPPLPDADQARTRLRDHGPVVSFAASRRRGVVHVPRKRERTAVG